MDRVKKIILLIVLLIPFSIYALDETNEEVTYDKITNIEILEGEITEVSLYKDYLINVKVSPDNINVEDLVWSTEALNTEIELKDFYLDNNYSSVKVSGLQKVLRAYKEGTYVVKVQTDYGVSDSIKIKAVKKVNDIEIYPPTTNLNSNYDGAIIYLSESDTLKLDYYVYPEDVKNKKLLFSSNDNNIMEVSSDGVITAKKVGSAKLIVKSDDGNVEVEYKIEVKDKPSNIKNAPVIQSYRLEDEVALIWDQVEGSSGYKVYRSNSKDSGYKLVSDTKDFYYYDTKLTYGKTYYYKVEAYNKNGSKTSKIISEKIRPEKVYNLSFSKVSSNSIKLTWDKMSGDGYAIYRSTNSKKDFKKIKTISSIKTLTFKDKTLSGGTTYYYKIRVYKLVSGKKVYSDYSSVFKVTTYPDSPKISVLNNTYNSLKISFNSMKNATKYEIYRSIDDKEYTKVKDITKTSYIDKNLEFNNKYYYKVKSCDKNNNCSDYSSTISNITKLSSPSLTTKVKNKKVKLTISSVDGSDGYEIYRSTKKKKNYSLISSTKKTKYTDTVKKKTYYYKVRSYKIVDNKKIYGPYSSIKKVKVKKKQ